MGITIHYRGRIADLERVEEFEDRVLDMALEIGAAARVWRSAADGDPTRIVRGLLLDLSPGQETTSLLLSPEGWLIPLTEIEAAEQAPLAEPPYCFVKTQFGSVEGHVALVELLTFLKEEFFPELEVCDEAGYWEHRDLPALVRSIARTRAALDAISEGLQQFGLSAEAAEDPEILATRIERIAQQVHRTLHRAPEHPPVDWEEERDWDEVNEAQWDALYKEQRRKQERLHRAIEDQLQRGADPTTAFENALRNEGLVDLPGESDSREPDESDALGEWNPFDPDRTEFSGGEDASGGEAWRESLPPGVADEDARHGWDRKQHPLQEAASDLFLRLDKLLEGADERSAGGTGPLMHGVGDIVGGLAQALSPAFDNLDRGLSLVQLKRAWRGAAFAKGALVPLCAAGLLEPRDADEVRAALEEIAEGIAEEISRIRRRYDDPNAG